METSLNRTAKVCMLAIFLGLQARVAWVHAQTLETIAGTELQEGMKIPAGWVGNGGPATEALLSNPFSVSADRSGLIYIADSSHNIVRVIDGSGIIRTIAGTGSFGFSGDGALAVDAQLATPLGVFAAATGDIYIADTFNNRIRMVDDNGLISTVGGTGIRGFSGDGGPATLAALASPAGIFVTREGSIFIADQGNHCIRMIDTHGTIETVAGTGFRGYNGDGGEATEAQLADPSGVWVGPAGNLFVADRSNYRIRRINVQGVISTVAGSGEGGYSGDGGDATLARLRIPSSVLVDEAGEIFVADRGNNKIRRIDQTGKITTVAGIEFSDANSHDGAELLGRPFGLAIDENGGLLIADTDNHFIRRLTPARIKLVVHLDRSDLPANGTDEASVFVSVEDGQGNPDPANHPLGFRVVSGEGMLSDLELMSSGGRGISGFSSKKPGRALIQIDAPGAWPITAQVEVNPVREMNLISPERSIPANGADEARLDVEVRELGGTAHGERQASFQIVSGEGEFLNERVNLIDGLASAHFRSDTPGRVRIRAGIDGAFPVDIWVNVLPPLPSQVLDVYEPDQTHREGKVIAPNGNDQSRTLHQAGEFDWLRFSGRGGYRYFVKIESTIETQIEAYLAAELLAGGADEITFWLPEERAGEVGVLIKSRKDYPGKYDILVQEELATSLSPVLDSNPIPSDGATQSVIRVNIVDPAGSLQSGDDSTQVRFHILEGDGTLGHTQVTVSEGVGETVLTADGAGVLRVRAESPGMEPVDVTINAVPALMLDLNPLTGNQGLRKGSYSSRFSIDLEALGGIEGSVGIQMLFEFDSELLSFDSFVPLGLMTGASVLLTYPRPGAVVAHSVLLGGSIMEQEGTIGRLTFEPRPGVEGEGFVLIRSAVLGGGSGEGGILPSFSGGQVKVNVKGRIPGLDEFGKAFGKSTGDPGFNPSLDFDGDGTIGFNDFVMFTKMQVHKGP